MFKKGILDEANLLCVGSSLDWHYVPLSLFIYVLYKCWKIRALSYVYTGAISRSTCAFLWSML